MKADVKANRPSRGCVMASMMTVWGMFSEGGGGGH